MENADIYNADELVPPTWMDADFFETVLKTAKKGDFKRIIKYDVGPATVKGDHYASVMFRGIVQYTDKNGNKQEISLIIKTMPEVDGAKKEFLNDSPIFETEIRMFRDIIPKFEKMLSATGDNTRLSANMLYYSLSPRQIIVLEDIKRIGFDTVGKRMATLEETKMALNILAKWHACSYILNKETKGELESFTAGVYNMPGMESNPVFTEGGPRILELAKKTPELHKYVEKLEKIQNLVFKKCQKVYDFCRKKGRINVLAHGDFHVKNLMFQFNKETKLAEKIILVDFQMCVWGSMALDLLYFLYMTIEGKYREEHQEELIYDYFQKFLSTLKTLGFNGKMPKFSDLQIDMLHICHIEVFLATTFLPFMVSFVEDPNLDPDTIMTDMEVQSKLYNSKAYIAELEVILKRLLHRGLLDSIIDDDE